MRLAAVNYFLDDFPSHISPCVGAIEILTCMTWLSWSKLTSGQTINKTFTLNFTDSAVISFFVVPDGDIALLVGINASSPHIQFISSFSPKRQDGRFHLQLIFVFLFSIATDFRSAYYVERSRWTVIMYWDQRRWRMLNRSTRLHVAELVRKRVLDG